MFLSTAELARRLHVTEQTVRAWHASGKITGYRSGPGGALRFHERQVMHELQTAPTVERDSYAIAMLAYLQTGAVEAVLQTSSGPAGGYLVGDKILNSFATTAVVGLRSRCYQFEPIDASISGRAVAIDTLPTAAFTEDLPASDVSEDSALAFGQRELVPRYLMSLITTSRKMLRAAPDFDNYIGWLAGLAVATAEDTAILTGDGVKEPLGIFTCDEQGVDSTRDVVCAATTAFTAKEVCALPLKVAQPFRRGGVWLCHPTTTKKIRQLATGEGDLVYKIGSGGEPDFLEGYEIVESESCPVTYEASQYVLAFANLQFYGLLDTVDGMTIQRLEEGKSHVNKIDFLIRKEIDGMPYCAGAFARLQLAAA